MSMMQDVDPQRISRSMRADLEALISVADMIDVLIAEANRHVHTMHKHASDAKVLNFEDWRVIKTFLNLAESQVDIVRETCVRFEGQSLPVAA